MTALQLWLGILFLTCLLLVLGQPREACPPLHACRVVVGSYWTLTHHTPVYRTDWVLLTTWTVHRAYWVMFGATVAGALVLTIFTLSTLQETTCPSITIAPSPPPRVPSSSPPAHSVPPDSWPSPSWPPGVRYYA